MILCNIRGADAQPTEDRLAVFSLAGMLTWLFMFAAFAIGLWWARSWRGGIQAEIFVD